MSQHCRQDGLTTKASPRRQRRKFYPIGTYLYLYLVASEHTGPVLCTCAWPQGHLTTRWWGGGGGGGGLGFLEPSGSMEHPLVTILRMRPTAEWGSLTLQRDNATNGGTSGDQWGRSPTGLEIHWAGGTPQIRGGSYCNSLFFPFLLFLSFSLAYLLAAK